MSMPFVHRLVCLLLASGLLVLAGCASGPTPSAGGTASRAARAPTRDGPPLDAPPNLAALPPVVPQIEPIQSGGPNKPYTVLGQSYAPLAQDLPWKERGLASWYGSKFHGRRTASGELFSMYGVTAAHRTLPIPSYARVRNVGTGQEIIVRVNDRGPFHSSRVLDLSYAAAAKLGVVAAGSAMVEIERLTFDDIRSGAWRKGTLLDPASDALAEAGALPEVAPPRPALAATTAAPPAAVTPAATAAPAPVEVATLGVARAYTPAAQGFWVQLAALSRREGVEALQQRLVTQLNALSPMAAVFHERPLFKLQVGPFATRDEALNAARQVREALQISPMVLQRR